MVIAAMSMSLDGFVTGQPAGPDERIGAIVMGRRSYDDPARAEPRTPCFVLSHSIPGRIPAPDLYTFVGDGIERAVARAVAAAGTRPVGLYGASVPQQALRAGLLDELHVRLLPVLLGAGLRWFDLVGAAPIHLTRTALHTTPEAVHLHYRVLP